MQSTRKCPKCHSPSLVYNEENNTLYCQNCGAVIEEEITLDSSFQQFEEERSEITYKHIEPLDELAEERDRKLMERFIAVVNEITNKHRLHRQVCKLAEEYFLNLIKTGKKITLDKIEQYAIALTYLAARKFNFPISYKALVREFDQSEKISRLINQLRSELKIDLKPLGLKEFLSAVLDELKIKDLDFANEVMSLIQEAQNRGLIIGKDIRGVVGGAIYIVAKSFGMRISQLKIAKACGVTEITIRNRSLELVPLYRELTGKEVALRKYRKKRPKVKF
ncbi:MAG: TFIIB-type zinc ribbon-containing protein [Candidatus Korarchaeota archaeon]|nr:hypothetical protein [Thermoproteota archaeon]MCR8471609.1 hypothetical protein [Thermoproteota archaeon]MCR8473037.1 hypothetical protein [Thermoproteota archaeon]MCR8488366.1 hypothetical protein [Thermoproteota archaeon]